MKLNLFHKILMYFMIVIVVSLTSVGIFTYRQASKKLDEQSVRQLSQISGNALYQTDLYLRSYERTMSSLVSDKEVGQFIDAPPLSGYDYYEYWSYFQTNAMKPLFIQNPEIQMIYLISYNRNSIFSFTSGSDQPPTPADIQNQLELLKMNTKNDGGLSALPTSIRPDRKSSVITLARKVRGLTSPDFKGVLAFEVKSKELETLWGGINLGEGGFLFILDQNGETVYAPSQESFQTAVTEDLKHRLLSTNSQVIQSSIDGTPRLFFSQKSSYSGWTLVTSVPLSELKKPIMSIRTTTIVVGLCTLIFAVWLAYRFGRSISRPVQVLRNGMRQMERGNWLTIPVDQPRDELDDLTVSFNRMVTRLSELVNQVYEAELQKREAQLERQEAEFQSLQLQINPHFLYNTFETIVCYAAIQNSKEITEIVKAMAYMLRYAVSTNVEEILVVTELKHVLNYMTILKHRSENEFELDVVIAPRFLTRKMVRLTLQPLVENAFQHAFPDGIEQHHYIRIDAEERDGFFNIIVEDNGVGIPEDQLAEWQEKLRMNRLAGTDQEQRTASGGIGLLNVHRRIQMVFGTEYGIRIESRHLHGTRVIMVMPF